MLRAYSEHHPAAITSPSTMKASLYKLIVSDNTHSPPFVGTPLTTTHIVMVQYSKPSLKRKTKEAKPAQPKTLLPS